MAAIDPSIPLSATVPNGMTSLGNIANTANAIRTFQTGQIEQQQHAVELQKAQIGLGERQGIQDLFAHPELFHDQNGQFDYDRLIDEGMKRAPTTFPTMVPQIIQARTAGVNYETAVTNLDQTRRTNVGQWFNAQEGKSLEETTAQAAALKKLDPGLGPTIDNGLDVLKLANKDQATLDHAYRSLGLQAMSPQVQAAVTTPSGQQIDTGAGGYTVNENRYAGTVGATIPGTAYTKGVPPTQPILMDTPQGPQQGVVGGRATAPPPVMSGVGVGTAQQTTPLSAVAPGAPPTARLEVVQPPRQGGGGGGIPTAPPIGTEGILDVVKADRKANAEASSKARTDIGLLQNLRTYADKSVTGVGADRQALVAGIAGFMGAPAGQDAKTYYDLINKNSAMLSGGNSDLERTLHQIATPNAYMTREAMVKAANQIIGQKKLAIVRDQYLSHFTNPNQYDQERVQFNDLADPLAMQWADMSDSEKRDAVSSKAMSNKEHQDFVSRLATAQARGWIK